MTKAAGCLLALAFTGTAGAAAARDDNWSMSDDVGPNPIVRTAHESYAFSPTGRVELRSISGSVEVVASDASTVEFSYERRAASEHDHDCLVFHNEHDQDTLRLWVEHKRERACRAIRASEKLSLKVPRRAALWFQEIGDSVSVTGVEGRIHLAEVGDTATLSGVQELEADSIGDHLKLDISRLGPGGIEIGSVGDTVELTLPKALDARLRIGSVGDEIRGPDFRMSGNEGYETVLGKGGPLISIDSVGDSVVIKGPRLKSMPGP